MSIMTKLMKQQALSLFFIASVLFLAGCSNEFKTPQQTPDNTATYMHSSIPFLVQKPVSATDTKIEVLRGNWNLDKGTIQMESEPIFEVNGSSSDHQLKWDGGDRIRFVTEPSPPVELRITDNRYEVDAYKSEHYGSVLLQCLSPDDKTILYELGPEGPFLDFRGAGKSDKIFLEPDLSYKDLYLHKPFAMTCFNGKYEIYFEFSYNREGNHYCGLVLCSIHDGKQSWKVISEDLGISEAGAGTRMTKHGEQVIIAEQDASIKVVDVNTGKVGSYSLLNERIKKFASQHVRNVEFQVPPAVYSFGDILIVQWSPAVIEEKEGSIFRWIPTTYIVAVMHDKILGEIIAIDNKLSVLKNDETASEIGTEESTLPFRWVFPEQ